MKKLRPFRRLTVARILPSLALCSLTLVMFSAVVYATAATNALTGGQEASSYRSLDHASTGSETSSKGETESSSEDSGQPDDAPISSSGLSLESPSLQPIDSDDDGAELTNGDSPSNSSTSEASTTSAPPEKDASTSAEAEKAYHAHIAKYFAELPTYYNHLCAGLNNAYAVANSKDAASKKVSISPVDGKSYIYTMDRKRVEAQNCTYNGKAIPESSKWYSEYTKVWRLYENLVNITSILREINGLDGATARKRLDYYSNSNGKIREIAAFEQNYKKVRL